MKLRFFWLTSITALTFVLSSCSNASQEPTPSATVEPQQTAVVQPSPTIEPTLEPIQPTAEPVVELPETNSAEDVLKEYLDAFIAKKFDDLKPLIYPDNFNITADELIQRIKENDFKTNVQYSEYMITSIKDYDETHKLVKLLVKPSNGSTALEDNIGLVLSDNVWKVDLSLVVKTESSDVNIPSDNNAVNVTKITKVTRLNGYEFNIEYKNNLKDNHLVIGFMNKSFAVLNTDKGELTEQLGKANVGPEATGSVIVTFNTPEKAVAQTLTINGVHIADSNNLPIPGKDTFEFSISVQ